MVGKVNTNHSLFSSIFHYYYNFCKVQHSDREIALLSFHLSWFLKISLQSESIRDDFSRPFLKNFTTRKYFKEKLKKTPAESSPQILQILCYKFVDYFVHFRLLFLYNQLDEYITLLLSNLKLIGYFQGSLLLFTGFYIGLKKLLKFLSFSFFH